MRAFRAAGNFPLWHFKRDTLQDEREPFRPLDLARPRATSPRNQSPRQANPSPRVKFGKHGDSKFGRGDGRPQKRRTRPIAAAVSVSNLRRRAQSPQTRGFSRSRGKSLNSENCVAGAGGFEPPYGGIKIRCLTAWRRPNARRTIVGRAHRCNRRACAWLGKFACRGPIASV